ncbi:hypothetical protein [Paenibacillus sedimenti]|uniref:Uncharacterized protein n=1 Tax=Paenibacillus sedimenti TaxID=2770274 RepID=A0A926KPT3_9BACL|nr:hypothetical protein [Paenibacillus sedimenti]MBD0381799.1 hypothetical protein [Paenibacillus sedimenti]
MDRQLIKAYAPYLYFDKHEPFFPVRVGVTVFEREGASPSFRRSFSFRDSRVKKIIEYAIYWDYDIQHLYELEHVWVYIGHEGEVIDCEASFHGKYLKGLLKDRSNLADGTHVRLYAQPGKHALCPVPEFLELVPHFWTAVNENAGIDGLTVPYFLEDMLTTNEETNRLVEAYLRTCAFTPTLAYVEYRFDESLFVPWNQLLDEIPHRIQIKIAELRELFGS